MLTLLCEFLIGAGLLILLGVSVKVVASRIKSSIDEMPAVVEDHRDRDAYEAEIAKVDHLSAKEEAEADRLLAFVEDVRTGEQQLVLGSRWAFEADPLSAPIPAEHADVLPPALFDAVFAERLSAFVWTADPAPSVPLSSVRVCEPDPLELEGPTGVFPKDWLDRAMAEAKAASR